MGEVTWSDIAPWYDELVRGGSGPHETAAECLLGLLPALDGVSVLDVACGQGLATREPGSTADAESPPRGQRASGAAGCRSTRAGRSRRWTGASPMAFALR
jgi:hypothetical protein